jgi:glyoxylase-like metal-dependent hydrolase (beta-lactamase superfamily II)
MKGVTTQVLAPNPSMFTGTGTNTYLVGGERTLVCIDPGPDDDAHLAAILAAAGDRAARITTVVLTHSHPDHRQIGRAHV